MRILLEAHHPAHVHFWKYPVRELQSRGHEVLLIGRDRDVMRRLLAVYDWIPSVIPPRKSQGNRFPLVEMLQRQKVVAGQIRRFRPDVVGSLMGFFVSVTRFNLHSSYPEAEMINAVVRQEVPLFFVFALPQVKISE